MSYEDEPGFIGPKRSLKNKLDQKKAAFKAVLAKVMAPTPEQPRNVAAMSKLEEEYGEFDRSGNYKKK